MNRWLLTMLIAMFLTSVAALGFFFPHAKVNTLKFEVAKAVLQLGVVSVIGVVVSLFTFEYQRARQLADKTRDVERKNLEYREELLKSTLAKTTAAYSAVKKARRLLRARAVVGESHLQPVVLGASYDLYMNMINDAQLDIENLARDIHTSAPAFTHHESLVREFYSIDTYLDGLIGEYEKSRRTFHGQEPAKELSEIPLLKEFMGPAKDSQFMKQVVIPFHNIQKGIRGNLLHPQLIRS